MKHKFVEFIPDELQEGVIYISLEYSTIIHECCCGCGNEVVTPLSPTDWELTFDGETVSLYPSIGNWNFKCRSHYWINKNNIHWAGGWSKKEINSGRLQDSSEKKKYYSARQNLIRDTPLRSTQLQGEAEKPNPKIPFWEKVKRWWS